MANHEWHWEQGIKFALEGMKVMLLLNGGAAIALLTFLGHSTNFPLHNAAWSLLAFGAGALFTVIAFFSAYMTQLNYGKEDFDKGSRPKALWWHNATYVVFALCVGSFIAGLGWACWCIGTA